MEDDHSGAGREGRSLKKSENVSGDESSQRRNFRSNGSDKKQKKTLRYPLDRQRHLAPLLVAPQNQNERDEGEFFVGKKRVYLQSMQCTKGNISKKCFVSSIVSEMSDVG